LRHPFCFGGKKGGVSIPLRKRGYLQHLPSPLRGRHVLEGGRLLNLPYLRGKSEGGGREEKGPERGEDGGAHIFEPGPGRRRRRRKRDIICGQKVSKKKKKGSSHSLARRPGKRGGGKTIFLPVSRKEKKGMIFHICGSRGGRVVEPIIEKKRVLWPDRKAARGGRKRAQIVSIHTYQNSRDDRRVVAAFVFAGKEKTLHRKKRGGIV